MTRAQTHSGNSVMDDAQYAKRLKLTGAIVGLVCVAVGIVIFTYREFESKEAAAAKANVHSAAFGEHKSAEHKSTADELHKFDVRMTKVEIEHVHRGKQLVYLVDEIEKIGKRVGSKPAAPPVLPDAAPVAGGTP